MELHTLASQENQVYPLQLSNMYPSLPLARRGKSHWLQSRGDTDGTGPCNPPTGHQRSAPTWPLLLRLGSQQGWLGRTPSGLLGPETKAPEGLPFPLPPPRQCSPWVSRGHWDLLCCLWPLRLPPGTQPKGVEAASGGLAGSDRSPTAQAQEHLLAVVQQPAIAKLLEHTLRLSQHSHALPRSRQEAGRQVAGG